MYWRLNVYKDSRSRDLLWDLCELGVRLQASEECLYYMPGGMVDLHFMIICYQDHF